MTSTTLTPLTREAVPFLDLVAQHRPLEEELLDVCRRAIRTAAFVGGSEVAALEREFADFIGSPGSVALNSGTDALRFAYMALGVAPGDEIITTPHTFIATTESITQAGGVIRFVDIDDETMTIDPRRIESAITPRTVGIVPVHLYGQSADMDPIVDIARRHKLWVVEDACQAHGATYKGTNCGAIGDLGAFSFYPGKNLGACGEGGAVTGADDELLKSVRQLRDHGQARKYYHDIEGYNGRMDSMQAGMLRVKLKHLARWNAARRAAAALYRDALAAVDEVRLPAEAGWGDHVYHLFVIRAEQRDALQAHLASQDIATGLHYPLPLHLQKAYAGMRLGKGSFPVTERTAETLLSLPMFAELTVDQAGRVSDAIREFYGR
jgi:dTDP-4-amino-4,6-dideoxygalactose transaminase